MKVRRGCGLVSACWNFKFDPNITNDDEAAI